MEFLEVDESDLIRKLILFLYPFLSPIGTIGSHTTEPVQNVDMSDFAQIRQTKMKLNVHTYAHTHKHRSR